MAASTVTPLALRAAALSMTLALGGCATLPDDGGFSTVASQAQERTGAVSRLAQSDADKAAIAAVVGERLARPLSVEDAVQVALVNNGELQALYRDVGIAQADLVQASRLRNPTFGFERTRSGDRTSIERTFTASLIDIITLPLASRIEAGKYAQARLSVANGIVRHAAETRRAYFEAVAAQQGVEYAKQVQASAEASAELATRMARVGNSSALDRAREEAFHAEAVAGSAKAARDAASARERLTRLMGLWGAQANYRLPERLPDLPGSTIAQHDVERLAVSERLDIQAARLHLAETASALGLTRATRFVNVLEAGYIRGSSTGEPRETGYELSIEIPLFDWGGARMARAEAVYMQSASRLAQAAVDARSEARASWVAYRTSHDLARHYRDRVIPLRQQISKETLLRYNGMLASTFELLADAREQTVAVRGYIEALRDFWIAQTDLQAAIGGRLPDTGLTKEQQK